MIRKIVLGAAMLVASPILAQRHGTGLSFDDNAYQNSQAKAILTRGDYQAVPSAASLKQYCPPAGNQLQLNTSVGWAVSYGAMTILKAKQNNWTDKHKIQQNAFSPIYSYYKVKPENDIDCSAPISLDKALNSLKNEGAPKFVEFLEFCPNDIDNSQVPQKQSVTGFNRLYDINAASDFKTSAVKKAIAEGYPVVVGMYVSPSFNTAKEFWQPREKFDSKFPGLALCVVGYDDNKYGGAFEVMNSWSSSWGNEGFIWIPYNYFNEFSRYAFEIYDVPEKTNADLGGALSFQLPDKSMMPVSLINNEGDYKISKNYGLGTVFRIIISNNATAFVYALGTDISGNVFQIFPMEGISPVLPYKSNNVPLPSEEDVIEVTEASGRDYVGIIYSREELPIQNIVSQMNSSSEAFPVRLRKLLGPRLVKGGEVNFGDSEINFQGKATNGSAVVITAELEYK